MQLSFGSPHLEREFLASYSARHQVTDIAWSLVTCAITISGFRKVLLGSQLCATLLSDSCLTEVWLHLAHGVWSLVILFLIARRWRDYAKWRSAVVIITRLARSIIVTRAIGTHEPLWRTDSLPRALRNFQRLGWRPYNLVITTAGYVLPLRTHLPVHLATLAVSARSSRTSCEEDCAGAERGLAYFSDFTSFLRRRLAGPLRSGGAEWPATAWDPCLRHCAVTHIWLQTAFGLLLPAALLAAYEEAARLAFLQRNQRRPEAATLQRERKRQGALARVGRHLLWAWASSAAAWLVLDALAARALA